MEKSILLRISDNGKGYPADALNSVIHDKSLGLTLIRMFTEQLNGTYNLKNDNVALCIVEFSL